MKEALIYGGAFNPPTIAHQAILRACVEEAAIRNAEVWLLPSGDRADKRIACGLERRLKLVDALKTSIGSTAVDIRVEQYELMREEPTQTYRTYEYFTEQYPEYKQTWVFGADSIATMKQWSGGGYLWKML